MAKARYRLTRTARQDLAEIGRYTERRWGVAQRRAYLAQLDARMDLLVDHPQVGVAREDVRPGYRCLREGRHLIFYRAAADTVEIVRILHQRMDVRRYLAGVQ
jgi:toxin ParE1/3/4